MSKSSNPTSPTPVNWHADGRRCLLSVMSRPRCKTGILSVSKFCHFISYNKKAQLSLTNPRNAKACEIAPIRRVSFHFTEFHFAEFQITDAYRRAVCVGYRPGYTQFEIRCSPILSFLFKLQVLST